MTDKQKETPESIMREALERIQCEFGVVINDMDVKYICVSTPEQKAYMVANINIEGNLV